MKLAFGWRNKSAPEIPALDYLNLGCGAHFSPEWVNVDLASDDPRVLAHDLRKPLSFAAASFSVVYHSHVLEHLSRSSGATFLGECFRVLKPAGILRVAVPDLEKIALLYLEALRGATASDESAARRYEWIVLELLDQMTREQPGGEMLKYWRQNPMPAESFVFERMGREVRRVIERLRAKPASAARREADAPPTDRQAAEFRARGEIHKWMYDRHSLAELLKQSGFTAPRLCAATESASPGFARMALDVDPDGSVRKPDSLFMEALKPR